MAIAVRGSAWDPFTTLVRQFDADFDTVVRRSFGPSRRFTNQFVPAADVSKDGNDLVVTLALPGVDVDKDIDIEVTEGRLAISGPSNSSTAISRIRQPRASPPSSTAPTRRT